MSNFLSKPWVGPIMGAIVGLAIWGVIAYRAHESINTTDRLCFAISSILESGKQSIGKPGTAGYSYYLAHPKELTIAKADVQKHLDQLPCEAPPLISQPPEARP